MSDKREQEQVAKKFLFDLNSFDEPEPIDPADLVPTFSEEELAAARAEGYAEGKAEGNRLAVQSREQLTVNTLRTIADSFTALFAAEYERDALFERESVRLTTVLLDKLFPVLNARFGDKEVEAVILNVLQVRGKKSSVTIEVSPDDAPGVETLLGGHWTDIEAAPRYRILPRADLKPGQCRLSWDDGGAVRDGDVMADKIRAALLELLGPDAPATPEGVSEGQNNAINEQDAAESSVSTTQTGEIV